MIVKPELLKFAVDLSLTRPRNIKTRRSFFLPFLIPITASLSLSLSLSVCLRPSVAHLPVTGTTDVCLHAHHTTQDETSARIFSTHIADMRYKVRQFSNSRTRYTRGCECIRSYCE